MKPTAITGSRKAPTLAQPPSSRPRSPATLPLGVHPSADDPGRASYGLALGTP